MPRMVLLQHTLPDGTAHFDLLLERAAPGAALESAGERGGGGGGDGASPARPAAGDPDDRCLIAFRLAARVDDPAERPCFGERLEDHRRAYLTYEGEVSNNRGHVARVAQGRADAIRETDGEISFRGGFVAGRSDKWTISRRGSGWLITNEADLGEVEVPDDLFKASLGRAKAREDEGEGGGEKKAGGRKGGKR